MDIINQYNFYLNFKKEIDCGECDMFTLTTLLWKYSIKFEKKIYDMFINTINKSSMEEYEKKAIKMFIFCVDDL